MIGLVMAVVAISSCENNTIDEGVSFSNKMIPVTIKAEQVDEGATKTIRNLDKSVSWMPSDEIAIFIGTEKAKFTSTNTENELTASFNGELSESTVNSINNGTNTNPVLGLYPYDEYAESWVAYWYHDNAEHCFISTTLPNVQTGIAGTFADDLFITVAKSDNFNLFFYNVCSGFKFSITKEGISSITLKGRNDECIAGDVELTFDDDGKPIIVSGPSETSITLTPEGRTFEVGKDYYIVMFPTLFSNGFTVSFETSNERAVLVIPKSVNFPRSKFVTKSNADAELTYQPYTPGGNINIPDANFKSYCVANFDRNNDGELSYLEAQDINTITCSYMNISSLEGIEYFYCLTELDCSHNSLTSLDTRNNSALKSLNCCDNNLSSLNVPSNSVLNELICANNQLTTLDVSNNTALTILACDGNQLTYLNVSNNTALECLYCHGNQLKTLDINSNTALTTLECWENLLTTLNLSNNTQLAYLECSYNQLTSLDISNNHALKTLYCGGNLLAALDISNNTALTILWCGENQLTTLNVSNKTALATLYCNDNLLTSLNTTNTKALSTLVCDNNQLASLNIGSNIALTTLHCYKNQLTALDVSNNTALKDLHCNNNQLNALDISNNTELSTLICSENPLNNLDISNNTSLISLHCELNHLSSLNVSNNAALKELNCGNNQLTVLDVGNNTELNILYCHFNYLTSLDVSKNIALTKLYCQQSPYLTEIWLKTGQTIHDFIYDASVVTVKYK